MDCPVCGEAAPARNTFCGRCGAALSGGADTPPASTSRPSWRREAALAAGFVALLAAAASVTWYLLACRQSPEAVVRAFVEADRQGRFADQRELVRDTADARMVLALFQEYRRQAGRSPFERSRIVGRSRGRETALIDVEVAAPARPGPSGAPAVITFTVVREGSRWAIDPTPTLASAAGGLIAAGMRSLGPAGLAFPFPGAPAPGLAAPP